MDLEAIKVKLAEQGVRRRLTAHWWQVGRGCSSFPCCPCLSWWSVAAAALFHPAASLEGALSRSSLLSQNVPWLGVAA